MSRHNASYKRGLSEGYARGSWGNGSGNSPGNSSPGDVLESFKVLLAFIGLLVGCSILHILFNWLLVILAIVALTYLTIRAVQSPSLSWSASYREAGYAAGYAAVQSSLLSGLDPPLDNPVATGITVSQRGSPGALSEIAAEYTKCAEPPEISDAVRQMRELEERLRESEPHVQPDPKLQLALKELKDLLLPTTDGFIAADQLYLRMIDHPFFGQATFHWQHGWVRKFVALTNNSKVRYSRFWRTTIPPVLPFLAGCLFHALAGAIIGCLLLTMLASFILRALQNPYESASAFLAAPIGAGIGVLISKVFQNIRDGATRTSCTVNAAVNCAVGGFCGYLFARIGHRGTSSMANFIVLFTTTLGGIFGLLEWLFQRKYKFGRLATIRSTALCCWALVTVFIELIYCRSSLGVLFTAICYGLIATGLVTWVIRPLGAFTGIISGLAGGYLGMFVFDYLSTLQLSTLAQTVISYYPEWVTLALLGLVVGTFLSLFRYCLRAFFYKDVLQNFALGQKFFDKIPEPTRSLAHSVATQFEELEAICDHEAGKIIKKNRVDLSGFEILLLGRKGNNRWLLATFTPQTIQHKSAAKPPADELT